MMNWNNLAGLNVTVMGLGLNGGGVASTRFFAQRGANVTVTDLRSAEVLAPSLAALEGLPLRLVLGRHDEADFRQADLVVKNPAVRAGNPYLALAQRIETDLSVFLSVLNRPVFAVTGSKGKSTTATALHQILLRQDPEARLGGNITVSPLDFLDTLSPTAPIVLELSSWQLADLQGRGLLRSPVACLTNLLWDHMNAYADQEAYARDKAVIFENQGPEDWSLLNADSPWADWFRQRTRAQVAVLTAAPVSSEGGFSVSDGMGWWRDPAGQVWRQRLLPPQLKVPGGPFRWNCLAAGAMAALAGCEPSVIEAALADFGGVEHRLEKFFSHQGVDYYNDTTATIPEAAAASVASFEQPVHWIAGGTDKNLEMTAYQNMPHQPASISLLEGSATQRMIPIFRQRGWDFQGPFANLELALAAAESRAQSGDVVLLSPGAASFELFKNEFYRGHAFKDLVRQLHRGSRG